jgi:hypothetical protein
MAIKNFTATWKFGRGIAAFGRGRNARPVMMTSLARCADETRAACIFVLPSLGGVDNRFDFLPLNHTN